MHSLFFMPKVTLKHVNSLISSEQRQSSKMNDINAIYPRAVQTMPESCCWCYKAHYVYKTWTWKLKTPFHTTRRMNTLFILSDKWHNMPKGIHLLRFQNLSCYCYVFEMVKYGVKTSPHSEKLYVAADLQKFSVGRLSQVSSIIPVRLIYILQICLFVSAIKMTKFTTFNPDNLAPSSKNPHTNHLNVSVCLLYILQVSESPQLFELWALL